MRKTKVITGASCDGKYNINSDKCMDCGEDTAEKYNACQAAFTVTRKKASGGDLPVFTAEEVNLLKGKSRRKEYYLRAFSVVKSFIDGEMEITPKTRQWLWGLKSELKEEIAERG